MKKTKKVVKTVKKAKSYPRTAGDAFASQKMLYSVRDELIAHTEKKFQQTEVRFNELKAEIHEVRAEIHELKAEIHGVKAQISQLEKSVHKIALLVEEQNNRNKIVLDGLSQLFERQERIEKKLDSSL